MVEIKETEKEIRLYSVHIFATTKDGEEQEWLWVWAQHSGRDQKGKCLLPGLPACLIFLAWVRL